MQKTVCEYLLPVPRKLWQKLHQLKKKLTLVTSSIEKIITYFAVTWLNVLELDLDHDVYQSIADKSKFHK